MHRRESRCDHRRRGTSACRKLLRPDSRKHSNIVDGGIASAVPGGAEQPTEGIFLQYGYGAERNLRLGTQYRASRVLLNYTMIDSMSPFTVSS